ncbi:MAG: gliding motility-associated C-terminal domain-containing protein, partial [Bacteroidota bacterium]
YEICKTSNTELCGQADVTINVTKNTDCTFFVPNGFSPEGDGINDFFKVKCISNYPNALLRVFTRSGINIYEKKHYGNLDFWGSETDAWWDGRTDNKWNVGGNKLATATYIYILELEEGNKDKVLTGSVFLSR